MSNGSHKIAKTKYVDEKMCLELTMYNYKTQAYLKLKVKHFNIFSNCFLQRRAEWLAQQLVMEFKRNWLPSHKPQRGRRSLRSSLQEVGDF